jgi:hypothetical protein
MAIPSVLWAGQLTMTNGDWGQIVYWDGDNRMRKKGTPLVMAKAFDILTCANNHPCYMATRKLVAGMRVEDHTLIPLGKAPPIQWDYTIFKLPCPECGALVFPKSKDDGAMCYNRGELMGDGHFIEET